MSVDFDKVVTDKVDGHEHQKKLFQFTVAFSNNNTANMTVQIFGGATSFDVGKFYLKTDNDDLGINILAGNQSFPLNSWLSFS